MKTREEIMAMEFRVSKGDIDNGCRCVPASCPVAMALERRTKENVSVGPSRVSWFGRLPPLRLVFPDVVKLFIEDFDRGRKVHPFSFRFREEDQP